MRAGVRFAETMRGELTDGWGRSSPIEFALHIDASHASAFARTGVARVHGVVHAPPWAEDAFTEGTMEIRPLLGRRITYRLHFCDEGGRRLEFRGRKDLSWWRPIDSIVHLPGELLHEGARLAAGELHFALAETLHFAASWSPWTSFERVDLGRRTIHGPGSRPDPLDPAALTARQLEILDAFAQACIVPSRTVPAADAQTRAATLEVIADLPEHLRRAYGVGLEVLDHLPRRRAGGRLRELDPVAARAWLAKTVSGPGSARTRLVHGLALPLKVAHFNRGDYLGAVGAPRFAELPVRSEPPIPTRYDARVHAPEQLAADQETEADVVVIGTGAGGAAIAAELAERGVAVVMLESGRYQPRSRFHGSPLARSRELWRHRGMLLTVGNFVASIPLGNAVGGTTLINSGTCFRTPDSVLEQWRGRGFPVDFTPERFAPWLDRVERELQVAPGDPRHLGRVAEVVAAGAEAMGLSHGPLPRNAPGCDGQGTCIYGCPTGAKRSSDVSWVPRAIRAGAELYTGMNARVLLRRGRRFVGVVARGQDRGGATRQLRIRCRALVVACGSLLTPGVLEAAGIDLPALGRNLSIHPGLGMFAMNETSSTPWAAIPQGYGVWGHELEGVRFEGFYMPPQMYAAALSAVGDQLTHWMSDPARVDQFGFMVRDENDGSVRRGPGGVVVHKNLDARTTRRLQLASALLAELLLSGGAQEVFTGIGGIGAVRSLAQARGIAHASVAPGDFTLLGAHPLSTCRMGASGADSVVDFEHRVHGTENLYVVDGGAVPTSLGVNPQMTIMAMALRAGALLASGLA